MKTLSFVVFASILTLSSCAHKKRDCCKDMQGSSCEKSSCGKKDAMKSCCKDGKCEKTGKASKECCTGDHCDKDKK